MYQRARPILLTMMLMAIAVRTVFGAPCCLDMAQAAPAQFEAAAESHDHHDAASEGAHSGHSDSNSANPCCSACGPTLPPETAQFTVAVAPRGLPQPAPIRALATRPPYPAYEATGPPLLI
ncbi:hypothetical protein [Erythrobacter crassostreae]|uniref:DUF2946 domain-containing protein n=1 Tax=Erythrobacter crassostreae TaxID=2828328 RepID=A0A9X1F3F4_9SPHN|nr:hypothetical protein [Erythrobacter crassostrea]MBV7259591.1 hypothetical protein [Erythrobacter crassostrea]